ncbi:MAG: hypothetical protein OXQ29_09510 [Rhodospirillaceae bacterium]|nr:hypothetical protein [Rhodospirillaceae bacterium]
MRPPQMVRLQPDDSCLDAPTPFLVAPAGMSAVAERVDEDEEVEAARRVRTPRRR